MAAMGNVMYANSREIRSNQAGVHRNLDAVVKRHLTHPWQAPVADYDRQAFQQLARWREQQGGARPLMLDTGCGTGRSSVQLARRYPQALVIAVDQSQHRLERAARRFVPLPENLLLLRADAAGLWRLMARAGWQLDRHQIFYPNPWPKNAHLKRRWHGHPAWPELLALAGQLEIRSNWPVYLQEAAQALALSGLPARLDTLCPAADPATDFEEKYHASGQQLWRLTAQLG